MRNCFHASHCLSSKLSSAFHIYIWSLERREDGIRSTPWPKGNAALPLSSACKVSSQCSTLTIRILPILTFSIQWQQVLGICICANNPFQECSMKSADHLMLKYHVLSVTRPLWWGTRCWHGSTISIHITHYTGARYVTRDTWLAGQCWAVILLASVAKVYFHARPISDRKVHRNFRSMQLQQQQQQPSVMSVVNN